MDKRVRFDFEIDFTNGGGIQGQDFRLDIAGDDISDRELADYLVADMRPLMASPSPPSRPSSAASAPSRCGRWRSCEEIDMVDEQTLQQIVKRIVAAADPSRIILFGSYGRGDATAASDLDIMVIKPQVADPYAEMVRLHQVVGNVGAGVDVLVYSEADFLRRSQVPGTVLYWARKEGKALYGTVS